MQIFRPSETRQTIEGQDKRPFFLFSGVSRLNYANPPVTPHCLIYCLTFFVRHGEINKENSILQFLLLISALFFQILLSIL